MSVFKCGSGFRANNRGSIIDDMRGRFRGGRGGERRGFIGENLNIKKRDHHNPNVNRYQQGLQKRQVSDYYI